jgi:crossover junction endodeoxyribonuclease RuvC
MDDVLITFVGIDPGLTGAVAVLCGEKAEVYDIPTIKKGDGAVKYEIDPAGLGRVLRFGIVNSDKVVAALERVNSMPGQAASSTFSLGDSFGVCRTVLSLTNLPLTYVTPMAWKKYFKLTKDKEEARALAIKRYPQIELHLKKHIDRAEALLIATYLKETYHA